MQGFLDAFQALNQLVNHSSRFSWFPLPPSALPLPQRVEEFYAAVRAGAVHQGPYRLVRLPSRPEFTRRVLPWLLHFSQGRIDVDFVEEALEEQLQAALREQKPAFWAVDQRASQVNPLGDVGWDLFLCELPDQVWVLYCGWND